MEVKQLLENCSKVVSILTDACKLAVLVALSVFAVASIVRPAWAKERLKDAGLSVKEINVFGVKLVANDAFDAANALAETKVALESYRSNLGPAAAGATHPITNALSNLDKVAAVLSNQSAKVNDVLKEAGEAPRPIPQSGWLYVGRISEGGAFTPGPRIDAAGTKVDGKRVIKVQLKAEAPVMQNGDDCVRKKLEDIHPPTQQDLDALQLLLAPNPTTSLDVSDTVSCPSIGNGQWLYAKVKITPADVKFVKFASLLHR
jgi:hypothetical protein